MAKKGREDDYLKRRKHLAALSDKELHQRFWDLAEKILDPVVELARTHTSPGIEQSVLLRMGFSSLEVQDIVARCGEHGLLGKGAGHIVWKLAKEQRVDIRKAGLSLMGGESEQNWSKVKDLFKESAK